jgi:DNA-binding transcriptional ArsR family regulator
MGNSVDLNEEPMMRQIQTDPDIAATAALIGDPSRATILLALMDGRALPAGELARYAKVSAATASSHLDRLFKGNLVSVEVHGRHHYYRLRDERVARLIEELSALAPPAPVFTANQRRIAEAVREARTCYGHLAGKLGVKIAEAMCEQELIVEDDNGYRLTDAGRQWLERFGVEADRAWERQRRPVIRRCLDWSERRHHVAGAVGVTLAKQMFELNWIVRVRESRAVRLTERGRAGLTATLGLQV